MEKKLTAVETMINWTIENAFTITGQDGITYIAIDHEDFRKEFDKYLELEKEQIINARQDGHQSTYTGCESGCGANFYLEGSNEQYYNETYKNGKD